MQLRESRLLDDFSNYYAMKVHTMVSEEYTGIFIGLPREIISNQTILGWREATC
jgi:hypothetical protein